MDKPLGIVELLQRVGEENVQLQNLVESMDGISMRGADSRVSFWTNGINATEIVVGKARNVGLVLWLPTELVEKARAEHADGEMLEPEARLRQAMSLLERVGAAELTPDASWWHDYFALTGEHVVLTDEGWELARDVTDREWVLDELNAPGPS